MHSYRNIDQKLVYSLLVIETGHWPSISVNFSCLHGHGGQWTRGHCLWQTLLVRKLRVACTRRYNESLRNLELHYVIY